MTRVAQPHDDTIDILATELAATAAHAMDQAGVALTLTNTSALTNALRKAIENVGQERERAVRLDRIERRAAWVCDQGLLCAVETARQLGLNSQELETARELAIIAPVDVPLELHATSDHFTAESWRYYPPTISLTEAERTHIAHGTLLTRTQAAERLGVPVSTFDRLRAAHGLTAVDGARERGGSQMCRYRTDAVDGIRAAASPDEMRGRSAAS